MRRMRIDFWDSPVPVIACLAIVGALAFWSHAAHATWKPEYAALPQEVQDWYKNATLTEAAHARIGIAGCCEKADVVKAAFRVGRDTGKDEWWWRVQGCDACEWRRIPDDIIHWGERAPGGQPTLFVWTDTLGKQVETCFYPPEGGI